MRLLPAYFATILFTLAASAIIATPNDYKQVSIQALFATAFSSNIGFWLGVLNISIKMHSNLFFIFGLLGRRYSSIY